MRELKDLRGWLRGVPRHRALTHGLAESDSEILPLAALGRGRFLASTVDAVSEEIEYGLYRDPYTMGWMCATASLSDLAAVGARPVGFLFSATWGPELATVKARRRAALGLGAALRRAGAGLLGGDSGAARSSVLTGVALGCVEGRPLSRVGLKPGDWLCVTGKAGRGPAWGFRRLVGDPGRVLVEADFRPRARLAEGQRLRGLATACIDTSDGLASSLATLCEVNRVGFEWHWRRGLFDAKAARFCRAAKLPLAALAFGEHGDFELVFGVRGQAGLRRARRLVPGLHVLGRVVPPRRGFRVVEPSGRARALELDLVARADKGTLSRIEKVFRELIAYCVRLDLGSEG